MRLAATSSTSSRRIPRRRTPAESFSKGEQWVVRATPQSVFVRDATGTTKLAVPGAS